MRRILFAPLLLACLALPAIAAGKKDRLPAAETPTNIIDSRMDPIQRFIESNVTETLYHEFAHALIDLLSLPVFGPEEYAADMLAIVMMNRLNDEATTVRLARDVAHAYMRDASSYENAGRAHANWDKHPSNQQRYYNLVCLIYGANPTRRERLADEMDLPEDRAETCKEEFDMTNRAWSAVLDRISQDAPGSSMTMDWILDPNSHLTRFVASEVDRLNRLYVLPEPVVVSVIPCGQVNAFYDPSNREIIICTELSEHLAKLAR
jgi:hypothetical protein